MVVTVNTHTVEPELPPLPALAAFAAIGRCVLSTARLLGRRRIRQPAAHVGDIIEFANGTAAAVYRETVVPHDRVADPTTLVVCFRLRWVRGGAHRLFRAESLLNTPLFVGFPGFVSKLWLRHDQTGVYRGIYEWDGSDRAHAYARALWRVLALVSEPDSIHYVVVPGCRRAEFLARPTDHADAWWCLARPPKHP